MSDKIEIKANEQGVVRVFAVDIPADQIASFTARNGSWPLREALGADTLDPAHIEVFDAADLAGVGLPGYLIEGHAIPEDQITPLRARLEAQTGTLMVITSRAFDATAQTLTPRAPLTLIASVSETHRPITFDTLPDASAQPQQPQTQRKKPRSDAAMSGRVAMVVLLVLALLVVVMVWIAS